MDRLKLIASHKHQNFAAYHTADISFREPVGLSPEDYFRWVCDTVASLDIQCLVPGHEQSFLTARTAELQKMGCSVFAASPIEFIGKLHDKAWVYEQTPAAVPIPKYSVVRTDAEFIEAVDTIRASHRVACVKPATSVYGLGFYRLTRNQRNRSAYSRSVGQWLEDFSVGGAFEKQLVMEYLPGHEYSVDIAARHGTVLAAVIRRKPLLPGPQTVVDHLDIRQYAELLVQRFQLNGLINIQFREDRNRKPLLLEINPRASGGIGMSCQAGINLPSIAYLAFLDPAWTPIGIGIPNYGTKVVDKELDLTLPSHETILRDDAESTAANYVVFHTELPTGILDVSLTARGALTPDQLLGFGARNNRKRGFLFVSKVLAKHVPVRPFMMRQVHQELAQQISTVVSSQRCRGIVLGMAETATGLGMGVFGELLQTDSAENWDVYYQTTRYRRQANHQDASSSLSFEESHSHATQLILELPPEGHSNFDALQNAETIVLVDDEISTGKTFASLLRALRNINSRFSEVIVATITDLSGGRVQEILSQAPGVERVHVVSLVAGRYSFTANDGFWEVDAQPASVSSSVVSLSQKDWSGYSARYGVTSIPIIPRSIVEECKAKLDRKPCRVIGTNEFMDPAFRLAMELEAAGWDTTVQSTTRSPLLISHEIKNRIPVVDPYCPQTQNYLYNFNFDPHENLIVVHESDNHSAIHSLVKTLAPKARCLEVNLLHERVVVHG